MVLLHVLLANLCPTSSAEIFLDIEKSLEIFRAMKALAVARRCEETVAELLSVAKATQSASITSTTESRLMTRFDQDSTFEQPAASEGGPVNDPVITGGVENEQNSYGNLVDFDLVSNFLNFQDWNAWSDASYR